METSSIRHNTVNSISFLQAMAAIAVVYMHVDTMYWTFTADENWCISNVIDGVMYFAVPVFFLIQGSTLLDYPKRYNTFHFFKKRFIKTVIPFIFWSIFAMFWCTTKLGYNSVNLNDISLGYIVDGIVKVRFLQVYWFFIQLFCVYLSIPLLANVEDSKKNSVFTYFAISGFLINVLWTFLNDNTQVDLYSGYLNVGVVMGYLLYVVIGYLLTHNQLKLRIRIAIYILGFAGLLVQIIGTKKLTFEAGQIITKYKGYNNLPCVLYSVAAFVFLQKLWFVCFSKYKLINKLVKIVSKYSFSMYLIHWYIFMLIKEIIGADMNSVIWKLAAPFIVVPVCIFIIWLFRKIPLMKYVLP